MLSERIRQLTPYTPGEQPRGGEFIKLNTNENPYPPAPGISRFLSEMDPAVLRRYPDPASSALRAAVAEAEGLSAENVFAGNGSDEILSFVFYCFFDGSRGPVLFPEHTYSFYPVYSAFYGTPYRQIPMKSDFSIDLEAYTGEDSCGIIFPNPNAPTGIFTPSDDIRRLLDSYPADRLVAVDEAYIDFGGESVAGLVNEYPNLLVIRTLSKSSSLAGLRIGYALGNSAIIGALTTAKDSFNSYPLDTIAQKCAEIAVRDRKYHDETVSRIIETREWFSCRMRELGWDVLPSKANFIFARKPGVPGREIYNALREKKILVRHFEKPGISDFVRISIGTDEEMKALAAAAEGLRPAFLDTSA